MRGRGRPPEHGGSWPWLYSGDLWRGPAAGQCGNINMDTAQITLTLTHPALGRHCSVLGLFSPDEHLALLGAADLEADVDLDPGLLPGHGGQLGRGHEGGEQQPPRHDVRLHHLGVHVLPPHHLQPP